MRARISWLRHRAYAKDLKAQQGGAQSQMAWIAGRAAGEGFQVSLEILGALTSPLLYKKMRLAPATDPPLNPDSVYVQQDVEVAQAAFDFAANLAANFLWGQLLYKYTLPLGAATLLSDSDAAGLSSPILVCVLL